VIVPAAALQAFCHYCGIFAAMNLWAETAVPTALALACARIKTELQPGANWITGLGHLRNPAGWRGVELWGAATARFAEEHGYDLAQLHASFAERQLYIHPIKLSKWH
jgi:hypothetical protein